MSPRRFSAHVLAIFALSSLVLPGDLAAQEIPSAPPITISHTPAPTCLLNTLGSTVSKGANIERDINGAIWISYFEARDGIGSNVKQMDTYRTDVLLDFYLDGKKVKMPKGSEWRYSGRATFTHVRGHFAPDAKLEKALRGAETLSIRYKKAEIATITLTGLNDAMPVGGACPATTMTSRGMEAQEGRYGPNRPNPILPEPNAGMCEFAAVDTKAFKALRIGGTARERKNMTLRLVGPFNGPIDANGHYWLPEDGGMQLLVDGKAITLEDGAISGQSEGANFAQVAVTFSDGDPVFAALKKAKSITIRIGKSEVFVYSLPKKHTFFAESAACFQPTRDSIVANATPRRTLSPMGNPGNWVPPIAYPRGPLRNGVEGVTGFTLTVDKYGYAEECTVTATSGNWDLDEATCKNLMMRARFNPKVDANGQLQRSTYRNRVRWQIPD